MGWGAGTSHDDELKLVKTPPSAPSDDDSQTHNMSPSAQQKPSQRSIPVYRTLEEAYPDTHLQQAARWNALLESFEKVYKKKAEFVCRAPGRVNLIGEHIDYSAFPVLPTAVEADILIACAPRSTPSAANYDGKDEMVTIENMDERYEMAGFTPVKIGDKWELGVDRLKGGWANFVKAGFCGVLEDHIEGKAVHADLLYTGSVPDGAGLSSSAAMVVASTLAFLVLNGKLDKVDSGGLVDMAVKNERVIGVNSGGMDQAASVLSSPSSALLIDFHPALEATQVPIPPSARFVISNTLRTHNLFETGKKHYNLRVVESFVASLLLHRHLGVPSPEGNERPSLRLAVEAYVARHGCSFDEALVRLVGEAEGLFGKDGRGERGWTWEEIELLAEESGLERAWLKRTFGESWIEVEATHFHLLKRTRHVFTETRRVLSFRDLCLSPSSSADEAALLKRLGEVMSESMVSCRDEYDCSSDELNELAAICEEEGAVGSRLTGAGWGGCTVSLLPAHVNVDDFRQALKRRYGPFKDLDEEAMKRAVLESKPGSGAGVYLV